MPPSPPWSHWPAVGYDREVCRSSNTPARNAITSLRRWSEARKRPSARRATARNCSAVCQCSPRTPRVDRARSLRLGRVGTAATRGAQVAARLTSNRGPAKAGRYVQLLRAGSCHLKRRQRESQIARVVVDQSPRFHLVSDVRLGLERLRAQEEKRLRAQRPVRRARERLC